MKKFMSVYRGRFAAALAILATALLLTACGGGDGGGSTPNPVTPPVTCNAPQVNVNGVCTTPAPAPVANISVTPSACTIASGESNAKVNVTYATSNATAVKLVNTSGTVLSTALSAGVNVDAFIGVNDYQVTATGSGGTTVQSAKVTCTCASGSVANGNGCAAVDSTGPVLTLRASTPSFTTAANFVSALIIIDANEVLGQTSNGIPLGTMAVRDSTSATTTVTVGFTDVAHKAVQLVASGLTYAKAYTATFTLPDIAGNTSTFVVPFTTPSATPTVLHYTDVIIANTDEYGWYPMKLVLTSGGTSGTVTFSAEKAVNATSFQTNLYPLWNCAFNKVKLATGAVKLSCQETVNFVRYSLVWNPVTNRITEYDGSEGSYPELSDATWVDTQSASNAPFAGWSAFAEIGAGWVWRNTTDRTVHFTRKSDGVTTILPLSIGLVKAFGPFSN